MALKFPAITSDTPTDGSFRYHHPQSNRSWSWNGESWIALETTVTATTSSEAPTNSEVGDLWWNSTEGVLKIFYGNATDSAGDDNWVDASPSGFNGIISNLNGSNLLYVDSNNNHSYIPDGSILRPYADITSAYNQASTGSTIFISPGIYTEDLNISKTTEYKINFFGFGSGSNDGNGVTINGKLTIDGSEISVKMSNLDLNSSDNSGRTLDIQSSSICVFENVNIGHEFIDSLNNIVYISNDANSDSDDSIVFQNCNIDKNHELGVLIDGDGESSVNFLNCGNSPKIEMSSNNSLKVEIRNCRNFRGDIEHKSGDLVINNSSIGNVISTASSPNILHIINSSLRKNDNSLSNITKSGSSSYLIRNNDSDSSETYQGSSLGYIRHSKDQSYNKSGWTSIENVEQALDDLKVNLDRLDSAAEVSTLDDVILRGNTTTTTAVIPFYYDSAGEFPSASTYHGAIAHSDVDGSLHFAHNNVWNELTNKNDHNDLKLEFDNLNYLDSYVSIQNFTDMKQYVDVDFGLNKRDIIVSETAPSNAANGDLWWDSVSGSLYIRYFGQDSEGEIYDPVWVSAVPSTPQVLSVMSNGTTSMNIDSSGDIIISSPTQTSIIPDDLSLLQLGKSTNKISNLFLSGSLNLGETVISENSFSNYAKLSQESRPLSPTSEGEKGDIIVDGGYMFVCTATNTWVRVPVDNWVVPTFTLTSSNTDSAFEGQTITLTLQTTDVDEGTPIPFTIHGTNITLEDFVNLDSLGAGEFTVGADGAATYTLELSSDSAVEGVETFTVILDNEPTVYLDVNINE